MHRTLRAVPPLVLLAALAAPPARAALVTDVATAADKDVPVQLNLDVRWRFLQHRTKILREFFDSTTSQTIQATELQYQRWTHLMDLRLALGIYHDLELHGDLPYALFDEQTWDYAHVNGVYVKPESSLENNHLDADGNTLADGKTRPIVTSPGSVYRGGWLDPKVGFAWGIFNGKRDQKLPDDLFPFKERTATWVIGFDYTIPMIDAIDPTLADPAHASSSDPLSEGLAEHQFDWWMAMSKRVGMVDPFFRLHFTYSVPSDRAYDNCSIVAAKKDPDNHIMSSGGKLACTPGSLDPNTGQAWDPQNYWQGKTGLEPPQHGGVVLGTEFIPIEQADDLRLAIVVSLAAEYVSKARTYTELSDALQKLTYSDQYFSAAARITFDFRLSKWVHWVNYVSLGTETPHFITSEEVGKDRWGQTQADPPDGKVLIGSAEVNPNYDFRLDQPGRRLMVTEVSNLVVSSDLAITF